MDKLYKVGEVAKQLQVNDATVRKWIREKKLEAIKLPSGGLRIRESDLLFFIDNI